MRVIGPVLRVSSAETVARRALRERWFEFAAVLERFAGREVEVDVIVDGRVARAVRMA